MADNHNAQKFAADWYRVDDIHSGILKSLSGRQFDMDLNGSPPPLDVQSRAFAEWLADQYRLAMMKGIQIGRGWQRDEMIYQQDETP